MTTGAMRQAAPYITFLTLGVIFFPSAGRDDVHITYWAAYTLSHFGEILNYNFEPIEQSSSLLHTLILAGLNFVTSIDIVDLGSPVAQVFGLATIYLTGRLSLVMGQDKFLPMMIMATSVPFIYWSFGALETSMISAIVLLLIIATIKVYEEETWRSYCLCLAAVMLYLLVRPEAVFVMGLFIAIPTLSFLIRNEKYAPLLKLLSAVLIGFLIIATFRYSYFNAFFPQPVLAKMGGSLSAKLYSGIDYYLDSFIQYPVSILLIAPIGYHVLVKFKKTMESKRLLILVSFLVAYLVFILTSGGDWMEGARFFVPVMGPSIVLAVLFYSHCVQKKRIMLIGLVLHALVLLYFALSYSTSYPIIHYKDYVERLPEAKEFSFFEIANRIHYRDIPVITEMREMLKKMEKESIEPVIMSTQAGMVPYHLFQDVHGKARFIDLVGLTTTDFTECAVTNTLERETTGLSNTYEYLMSNTELLKERCGFRLPDIIYDLDMGKLGTIKLLQNAGYTLVYFQTGYIGTDDLLSGLPIVGRQFIVVKEGLAAQLGMERTIFRFQ